MFPPISIILIYATTFPLLYLGQIVVEGAEGNTVYLFDVVGRLLATKRETAQEVLLDVPASGAYLVKIGDAPARRVVVRR